MPIQYKIKTFLGHYLKYLSAEGDVTLTDREQEALYYTDEGQAKLAALTVGDAYILKQERIFVG